MQAITLSAVFWADYGVGETANQRPDEVGSPTLGISKYCEHPPSPI
jgi:hypothetical protein